MPFQVFRKFLIGGDVDVEFHLAVIVGYLADAVMFLAPSAVIDIVVVIAGAGDGDLEKVGIDEHSRC